MNTTATATITYRKTKSGEWVAYGPATAIRVGTVTVTKKSGETKTETVERLGRTFTVDGTEMVYDYLAKSAPTPRQSGRRHSGHYHTEADHEDRLSFGPCSTRCPYNFA